MICVTTLVWMVLTFQILKFHELVMLLQMEEMLQERARLEREATRGASQANNGGASLAMGRGGAVPTRRGIPGIPARRLPPGMSTWL